MSDLSELVADVGATRDRLEQADYLADTGLATALFCAVRLPQALLLEGEPGVGKTDAARALATALDTELIRLQCHEGIDASEALYGWNHPRQLVGIRLAEAAGQELTEADLFRRDYLIERPLLRAIEHPGPRPAVLLVDEVDRSDDRFETLLIELLADAAVTIPELGTVRAQTRPIVVLTSNGGRDLSDALLRHCLYHWLDYPSVERAVEIIRRRVPAVSSTIVAQVAASIGRLRTLELERSPGLAEAIDWVSVIGMLGFDRLDEAVAEQTLGAVLKHSADLDLARGRSDAWLVDG